MAQTITAEADWQNLLKQTAAVKCESPHFIRAPNNRAVWFETSNFGWLLSAKDENGKRKIIAKF